MLNRAGKLRLWLTEWLKAGTRSYQKQDIMFKSNKN